MALRDNPFLPLYVQDYLTDEKLSCCSLATQGVYIRIMCVFHKSETYGGILFKQTSKQNSENSVFLFKQNLSSNKYFAYMLSKMTGVEIADMEIAIEELLFFNVLKIEQRNGVDFLFQKRMVKDFDKSEKRAQAGKKGGGNPVFCLNKPLNKNENLFKQTPKQNTESDNEYENINNHSPEKEGLGEKTAETPNVKNHSTEGEESNNGESEKSSQEFAEVMDELSFENVWAMYERKGNKKSSKRKWNGLPKKAKLLAVAHIPKYVTATPVMQYRKNFESYISQEAWDDEIITRKEYRRDNIPNTPIESKFDHNAAVLNEVLQEI
jgi:hypothetical protein